MSNSTVRISIDNVSSKHISHQDTFQHATIINYLSIYALILIIVGTVGNIVTLIVLSRPHLRRFVTVQYLIAVSICDIISLYGWNLNSFYKFKISAVQGNIEDLSLIHCRVISFMTFAALQLSSWCLSAVSLDRCLSLYWLQWKQSYGRIRYTKFYITLLALACIAINSHILFFNGYQESPNKIVCYATRSNAYYIYSQWERVHLVLYNLCPFSIMFICNTYIIYVTVRSSKAHKIGEPHPNTRKNLEKYRQFTALLIIVTFVFVILTLPSCIYYVFFRNSLTVTAKRNYRFMIQILLNSIQFTSHGINFFLYCFSAVSFRRELYGMIRELFYHCHCSCHCSPHNTHRQQHIYVGHCNNYNYTPATPLELQPIHHA